MKRRARFLLLLFLPAVGVFAQINPLEIYQENFAAAKQQTKLAVLHAAADHDAAAFGPLYAQALNYVINNADQLTHDEELRQIALITVAQINAGAYQPAVEDLWRLFLVHHETNARIQIVRALGNLAGDNEQIIDAINEWVLTQNNLTRAADTWVDTQVLSATVAALGELGSPLSFSALLDTVLLHYADFVNDAALGALASLNGEPVALASAAIASRDMTAKGAIFDFFLTADFLSAADRSEVARLSLAEALGSVPESAEKRQEIQELRFRAVEYFGEVGYAAATEELIAHFNQTVLEWDQGRIPKTHVLAAITALGATGTAAAAERLTDYLELLNTYSELDRPYDTSIVLATIMNLRWLAVPSSYNALFYTTLLENYPDRVKEAAQEAMLAVAQ